MKCAPFTLTSVTSSWRPFCLRRIGRISFSKRLFNSVSLPPLIWKWTLRANFMRFLLVPWEGVLHRRTRNGGSASTRDRSRLGPLKDLNLITRRARSRHGTEVSDDSFCEVFHANCIVNEDNGWHDNATIRLRCSARPVAPKTVSVFITGFLA